MSYEAYKSYRLAPDSNGCWDVLNPNYEQQGAYPSKAAAKRAIDELTAPATSNISNEQALKELLNKIAVDIGFYDDEDFREINPRAIEALTAYIQQEESALLNELLGTELPWPTDVFGEVPTDDWPKINDFAEKELGYPIDRISATLMRRGWKCFARVLTEKLKDLNQGGDTCFYCGAKQDEPCKDTPHD